jgi:hypothetical protein
MLFLLFFSFLAGFATILAPCIWPLLPLVLSVSSTGEKRKPFGLTLGVMTSFTLFTLFVSYLEPVTKLPLQRIPTNQRTSQKQESLVDIGPPFKPHPQAFELVEPRKSPLHHPPELSQSASVFGITLGQPGSNPPFHQSRTNPSGVVGPIPQDFLRPFPRMSRLSPDLGNQVHQV